MAQSFSSVIVRAEEFNSLSEGMPIILHAVAAGLKEANGDIGQLRKLVIDGKVSSEAWFRALEAGSVIIQQKVGGATLTVGQGLENMRTAMIDATRDFAKGSLAAEGLGDAFKTMADAINGINFKEFGEQVRELVGFIDDIRQALGYLQTLGINIGRATGLDSVGDALTGGAAQKSFLGGAFTITNQRGLQRRIDEAFGSAVETAAGLTEEAIRQSAGTVTGTGKTSRLPSTTVKPVSLGDYEVPASAKSGSGGGGGRTKQRADDYERLSRRIADSTAALVAETEVQRQLNPLVDDYGYALEKARTQQELIAAAKKAGLEVTPQLMAQINELAESYANASASAEQLAERQNRVRETAEEMRDLGKDVLSGFINDLRNGTSAAEALQNALGKIADKLLDIALTSLFKGFNPLSFLGLKDGGAVPAFAGGGRVIGPGGPRDDKILARLSNGEFVVNAKDAAQNRELLEAINSGRMPKLADGGFVTRPPSMPSISGLRSSSASSTTYAPVYQIDARGADQAAVARLEAGLKERDRKFGAMVDKRVDDRHFRKSRA